jgi:uncharacterized membrane protein (UPF0127 family)
MNTDLRTAWLVRSGDVLASADIADTPQSRRKGVIGRTELTNAMVITQCKWIHTIGVKIPLDVAYLDALGTVIKTERVKPLRISAPVSRCKTVVEASAGSFERWNLKVGDVIEVRNT